MVGCVVTILFQLYFNWCHDLERVLEALVRLVGKVVDSGNCELIICKAPPPGALHPADAHVGPVSVATLHNRGRRSGAYGEPRHPGRMLKLSGAKAAKVLSASIRRGGPCHAWLL